MNTDLTPAARPLMRWARTLGGAALCALGVLQTAWATTPPVPPPMSGTRPGDAACELFLHRLPGVRQVQSHFSLQEFKGQMADLPVPLD